MTSIHPPHVRLQPIYTAPAHPHRLPHSKPTSPSPPTCQSICSFLLLSSPPPLHPIRFTRFLLFLACVPLLPSISSNLQRKRERWSCSCERHTGQQHHFRTHYAVAEPREKPAKHVIRSLSEIQTHPEKNHKKRSHFVQSPKARRRCEARRRKLVGWIQSH